MTNRNWALQNMLLPEDRKRRFADWRDIIILVVLSLLIGFLSIGKIYIGQPDHDIQLYNNGFYLIGLFVTYNTEPNWFICIPVFVVYGVLLFLFFFFRYKQTGILPKQWLTTLVFAFIAIRIVGNFVFPYGEQSYRFYTLVFDKTVDLNYEGLSISGRLVQAIADVLYILFFYLCFTYVGTFSKSVYPIFHLGVHMSIIICIVLITVSLFQERDILVNNILYYLGKADECLGAVSLTTHKNVYGFFLLCGTLGGLFYTFRYHNLPFLVMSVIFAGVCFLVNSRTPAFLSGIALVLGFVCYLIFNFKKHKTNSIFMLVCLVLMLVVVIMVVSKFGLVNIWNKLFVSDDSTIEARDVHFKLAASMFEGVSPLYLIFGYGRIPFSAIYMSYESALDFEIIWTCHNSYLETIMFSGIVGIIAVIFAYLYIGKKTLTMFIKFKDRNSIVFLIMQGILMVYSIFEPRMLFLQEGTEQFIFFFLFFYPLLLDSGHTETDKILF